MANWLEDGGWPDAARSTVSQVESGQMWIDLTQLDFLAVAVRVHPVRVCPNDSPAPPAKRLACSAQESNDRPRKKTPDFLMFWHGPNCGFSFSILAGHAEFSNNSAKEHGALQAGFDNIQPFNRFMIMKLLPLPRGHFDRLRMCPVLKSHAVAGYATARNNFPGQRMKSSAPGT